MLEFVWGVIREIVATEIIKRNPWGILSWAMIILGFGAAFFSAGVENWIAVWIFSAIGVLGVVGLYRKYRQTNS